MSAEQEHKDRVSAFDAMFLSCESSNSHMHMSALLIFNGPPPKYSQIAKQIDSRLHLVPRFRQKLAFPPFGTGRPIWVDDSHFNIEHHLRQTDLSLPGSDQQLQSLAESIVSQQLDRTKPLWEFFFITGLSENRFAMLCKAHHVLADGIAGVNIVTLLFDVESAPKPAKQPDQQWMPQPAPSKTDMAIDAVREQMQQLFSVLRSLIGAAKHPMQSIRHTGEALAGLGEVARHFFLDPAPDTFLNVDPGPNRRLEWAQFELDQFKQVKNAVGGTVNDVVLSVIAGALAKFFRYKGQQTEGLELKGLVPVSIRAEDERGQLGNRLAGMRGRLPLFIEDPLERLRYVSETMDTAKESRQALGAEVMSGINEFMPPVLLPQTSRINFSTRLFNLLVTNIPGPQFPLYVLGHRLLDFLPITFLSRRNSLAIVILSYDGSINFGLLADHDAFPDLQVLREDTEQAFAELYEAATGETVPSLDADDDKKTPQAGSSENPARQW